MSLYNLVNGVTPATLVFRGVTCRWFILPMLGKRPDEYPRFRDCFISDEEHPQYDGHIHVYTRTGGGNREEYAEENQAMRNMPGFVADFDDPFDSTFATWVFAVPEKWQADFQTITEDTTGRAPSEEYQSQIKKVFPKIADKIDAIFATAPATPGE